MLSRLFVALLVLMFATATSSACCAHGQQQSAVTASADHHHDHDAPAHVPDAKSACVMTCGVLSAPAAPERQQVFIPVEVAAAPVSDDLQRAPRPLTPPPRPA